jgi:hypothetical protein
MSKELGMRNRASFQHNVVVASPYNAGHLPDSNRALVAGWQSHVVPDRIANQRKASGKKTRYEQLLTPIRGSGVE